MHKQSMRTRISCLCLLTIVLFSVMFVHAQEFRGTILGRVTDSSGAVVAGASITAVGPQQKYTAKTNGTGDFTIPFVQPGTYSITAEAAGFKTTTQKDIEISVSKKVNVNFALEVGATSETVTVSADAVGVNTADASVGQTLDTEKVQNLPLNGRQMYMLLPILPGALFTQEQFGAGGFSGTRAWDQTNAYVINGVQYGYNQFTLNGATVTQQNGGGHGTWNIAPNVDAVSEFKIQTNTYDASVGRSGGGTINTILKSGTNQYHGTAYDYLRNTVLDANTFQSNQVGQPRSPHIENQFGGTFGGPVRLPHLYNGKDKTFFFVSYEGYREVMPMSQRISVPSLDLYPDANGNVNFTQLMTVEGMNGIYDPATLHRCTGAPNEGSCKNGWTRDQFPNNTIPASRISPVALKMLALFPKPNLPGEYDNYQVSVPGRYRTDQPIARIDHNFSDATRFYGMFAWQTGSEYRNSGGLPTAVSTGNINSLRTSLTQVLDVTHTFGPTTFLDVRASFNRMYDMMPDGGLGAGLANITAASLGLNMPIPPTTTHNYAPEIYFDNPYANLFGNQDNPSMFETYQFSPSVTKVVGKHNLHMGAEVWDIHNVPGGVGNANGNFEFGPGFTQQDPDQSNSDGDTWASFLLGIPYTGSAEIRYPTYETYHYYAGYIQDDWKIRHNITLNIGLRWDMETSPVDRQNHLYAGMCWTCASPLASNAQLQANFASLFPGGTVNGQPIKENFTGGFQYASSSLTAYAPIYNQWQPRFGISWGINDKTVLHGGFGKQYATSMELGGAGPWSQSTNYTATLGDGLTPTDYFATGNPYPFGLTPVPGASAGLMAGVGNGQYFDDRNRPIPGIYQYSLGIQRELPAGFMLDTSFVGTYTKHLRVGKWVDTLTLDQLQQGIANPNFLRGAVPNPWYGVLPASTSLGSSPTIFPRKLMVPYPQFDGLYTYTNPVGYSDYNSLQVKLEKKMTGGGLLLNGLNLLTSFTWSRSMQATGYLNNNSYYVDPNPVYVVSGSDRPFVFAMSGVWGLPVGKGGMVASNAHGVLGQLINGWQMEWIFTAQSGVPTGLPNSWIYNCSATGNSYLPSHQSWTEYLYNENMTNSTGCFSSLPTYALIPSGNLPRVSYIRNPEVPQLQLGFSKKFALKEGLDLQFKGEAFNALNTPKFGGPDTNPNDHLNCNRGYLAGQPGSCTGYGTIGATQLNFPRQVQFSLKLLF
jgi:hypothetical protein